MVTVSVVIPTYNRADVLPRAIDSVLQQTYEDFELIVVDDGSTDDTEEVINSYSDNKIQYIRFDSNKGANVARNKGVEQADGTYILFLDSDDELCQHAIGRAKEVFDESTDDIAAVFYSTKTVGHGTKEKEVTYDQIDSGRFTLEDYANSSTANPIGGFSSVIFRRKAIETVGLLDESMPSSQDIDIYIRLLKSYEFKGVQDICAVRHHTNHSIKYTENIESDQISHNYEKKIEGSKSIITRYGNILSSEVIGKRHYSIAWYYYGTRNISESKDCFKSAFFTYPYSLSHIFYYIFSRFGRVGMQSGLCVENLLKRYVFSYF